jgi:hypothetical protein
MSSKKCFPISVRIFHLPHSLSVTDLNLHDVNNLIKVKVKCTLVQALRLCTGRTAHRWSRGIALLFHDHGTRRAEGSASRPGRSLPPGKTRYQLYRRLDGPQGRSGQVRKLSPPPRFDPWTFEPVTSRYTDYSTWPTNSRIDMPKIYGAISYPCKTAYRATLRRHCLSPISV